MKQVCAGLEFDFPGALDVFVFDETNKGYAHYHGLSHAMKAVDLIVELEDCYLFIEIKDFHERERYQQDTSAFNFLRESLKYKYRDSWIYRWCEQGSDGPVKPIKYICLLEKLDKGLLTRLTKELKKQIPIGPAGQRWHREICKYCAVLNLELWNRKFPKWPIIRV